MELERIKRELEDNSMLRSLFEVATKLSPESVSAITAFATRCFDDEVEGYDPECYRTVELLRGDGYRVEIRWVTRVTGEDLELPPYETEEFERAVIVANVATTAGAGLLKRLLTTDFELESIDCVRYTASEKIFEIVSKPMEYYQNLRWYTGLKSDLMKWSIEQEQQDMESMLEKKASLPC